MTKRLNSPGFIEMLSLVNRTRESIHNLSMWILEHKYHCFDIVDMWFKAVRKGDTNHRLTLFYVANDVVLLCKRHDAPEYREAFANILETAMAFASDAVIRDKIIRIVNIWEERCVYHPGYIKSLKDKLMVKKPDVEERGRSLKKPDVEERGHSLKKPDVEERGHSSPADPVAANCFNVGNLVFVIQEHKKLANAVRKLRLLGGIENFDIDLESVPSISQSQGPEILKRLNSAVANSNAYVSAVVKEYEQHKILLTELERAREFYTQQNADVHTVDSAYKVFGRKLKRLRKQLSDKKSLLSSSSKASPKTPSSTIFSGVSPNQKESISHISEEVSSLDQRLSLLTQKSPIQELNSPFMKANSSPFSEKHSPSQTESAHELQRMCNVSPENELNIDSVHCIPGSNKGVDSLDSSRSKPEVISPAAQASSIMMKSGTNVISPVSASSVPVQFIDLIEDPVEIKSPMKQPLDSQQPMKSLDLPEAKSVVKENPRQLPLQSKSSISLSPQNLLPVESVNLPEAKICAKHSDICHGAQNSCQQHHSSGTEPSEDIEVVFIDPKFSKKDKETNNAELSVDSQVNEGSPVKDNISNVVAASVFTSSSTSTTTKTLYDKLPSEEMAIGNTASTNGNPSNGHQSQEVAMCCDDEVVIISEKPKEVSKKSANFVQHKNCKAILMQTVIQAIIKIGHVLSHGNRPEIKRNKASVGVPSVNKIFNLRSIISSTSSSCHSSLNNNCNEPNLIVISDEPEFGVNSGNSSNKVQGQLTSIVGVREQSGKVTENLEIMDMDLDSSDEEKT